jgi:hypothetical protein
VVKGERELRPFNLELLFLTHLITIGQCFSNRCCDTFVHKNKFSTLIKYFIDSYLEFFVVYLGQFDHIKPFSVIRLCSFFYTVFGFCSEVVM